MLIQLLFVLSNCGLGACGQPGLSLGGKLCLLLVGNYRCPQCQGDQDDLHPSLKPWECYLFSQGSLLSYSLPWSSSQKRARGRGEMKESKKKKKTCGAGNVEIS